MAFAKGALGPPEKAAVDWRDGKDDIKTEICNPKYLLCKKFQAKTVVKKQKTVSCLSNIKCTVKQIPGEKRTICNVI